MSKLLCSYSGLVIPFKYMGLTPSSHLSTPFTHPIFSLEQKYLLSYVPKFFNGELSKEESYLLFLSLLNSTSLIKWNNPAIYHEGTFSIVSKSMERLARVIGKINIIKHPAFQCPKISINKDTATLENADAWVASWDNAIESFLDGNRKQELLERISRREAALSKLILSPEKSIREYAGILARWADDAVVFPRLILQIEGRAIRCNEYWQDIIIRCANGKLRGIPKNDIIECYDYCMENIETNAGSIYSHTLFKLLLAGIENKTGDIGLSGDRLKKAMFKIIDEDVAESVEDANISIIKSYAPDEEPKREDYDSALDYLKAKTAWKERAKS